MKRIFKTGILLSFFGIYFFQASSVLAAGIGIQGPIITPNSIKAKQENTLNYSFTLPGTKQDALASCPKATETGNIWWQIQIGRTGSAWRQVAHPNNPILATSFPLSSPITGTFKFTPGNGDTTESFQVVLYCDTTDPNDPTGSPVEGRQFSASQAVTINVTGQTQGQAGISFNAQVQGKPTPFGSPIEVSPGQPVPLDFTLSVTENSTDIQKNCGTTFIKWQVAKYPANQNDNFSDLINEGQIDTVDFGSGKTFPLNFQKTITALNQDFIIKARMICSGATVLTTSSGIRFNAGGAGGTGGGAVCGNGQCEAGETQTTCPADCKPGTTQTYPFEITNPLKGGATDFAGLVKIIAQWIFNLAIPIAVAMIVYSGILFLTSQGEPGKITKAKQVLTYAVIGLAIILIGNGFVTLIQSILELGGTGTNQTTNTTNVICINSACNNGVAGPCQNDSNCQQNTTNTTSGAVGSTCVRDSNCFTGLKCNGICQRQTGNKIGEACLGGTNCDVGLACDLSSEGKISSNPNLGSCFATSAAGGRIGDVCQADKNCISGLKCNQICQRKGGNLNGETCLSTSHPSNCQSTACSTLGTAVQGTCINPSATNPNNLVVTASEGSPAKVGQSYIMLLVASNGSNSPSLSWSIVGGSLPPGLNLSVAGDGSSNPISGIPNKAGTYTAVIIVKDNNTGQVGEKSITITVSK